MTIIIIKNGNMCQLDGPQRVLIQLFGEYKIKHPNAWHIQKFQRGKYQWDGTIKYISQTGSFKIGLLPKVYESLERLGEKVKIEDRRLPLKASVEIPKYMGKYTLYPRQREALRKLLNNKVGGVPFLICSGEFSVGLGKTLLMCGIHQAFQSKLKTLVLLNDSDLFNQFKREIPEYLPNEDLAFIQGSKVEKWGNFNVAMVQSLSRNLKKYQQNLLDIDIVLLDECDVIDNRTYKSVIERLYNARIRIGMSGTLYMSKLKKDLVHNMNIMSFIGPVVDTVKLKDQMKAGKATPVVVKMVPVQDFGTAVRGDYAQEYQDTITDNEQAYEASWERALYNARYHRLPMLIVTKFINHCESLYKFYCKRNSLLNHRFKIAYVHHETKERKQILEDFRNGKIDILISTTIISRGKNFPSLKYLQNTASMDSNEKAIQILGRLVRQHESKTKAYLDDLMFQGNYLTRHGRHRKVYYQKERLKVIILKNSYPLPNV